MCIQDDWAFSTVRYSVTVVTWGAGDTCSLVLLQSLEIQLLRLADHLANITHHFAIKSIQLGFFSAKW
jgi:hypothetical protein